MKPTIETSRIRANLRLYAELGDIPTELVPVIERALGLDYVEAQFKKRNKHTLKNFGRAIAEVLDEYNVFINTDGARWTAVGDGIFLNGCGYTMNASTFRKLHLLEAKNKRVMERVKSVKTIEEAKEIIAEENSKIENHIKYGE